MINQRGAASLLAILFLTALLSMAALSITVVTIGNLESGFSVQQGSDVILSAEGCVEEAILRLTRDSGYTGGTLIFNSVTCTIVVTGSGPHTITVDAEANSYTRNIQAVVNVSGTPDITSWTEVD